MSMHPLSTRSSYLAHKFACCFNLWHAGGSIACGTLAIHYILNELIFSSKSLNGDIGAVGICSSLWGFHKKVVRSFTLKGNSFFYDYFCLNMLGGEFNPAFRFSFISMFYYGCSLPVWFKLRYRPQHPCRGIRHKQVLPPLKRRHDCADYTYVI